MKIKNRRSGNPCRGSGGGSGDNSRCGAVRERLCAALRGCARPAHVGAGGCQTAAGHVGALIPFCVFLFFLFILLFFRSSGALFPCCGLTFVFRGIPANKNKLVSQQRRAERVRVCSYGRLGGVGGCSALLRSAPRLGGSLRGGSAKDLPLLGCLPPLYPAGRLHA